LDLSSETYTITINAIIVQKKSRHGEKESDIVLATIGHFCKPVIKTMKTIGLQKWPIVATFVNL